MDTEETRKAELLRIFESLNAEGQRRMIYHTEFLPANPIYKKGTNIIRGDFKKKTNQVKC